MSTKTNEIAAVLETSLSRPPAQSGLRLRSEDELASIFGINRKHVRKSLDILVKKGILTRRQGSGTYIRRVPHVLSGDETANNRIVSADALFANLQDSGTEPGPLQPARIQQQLHLGLWSDLHVAGPPQQKILSGIINRASEIGHRLAVQSIVESRDKPLSLAALKSQLHGIPCDGYIVSLRWADIFLEAVAALKMDIKVVFFRPRLSPVRYQPVVMMENVEAVDRAVRILAEQGFKRIALMGLNRLESPGEQEQRLLVEGYQRALRTARLDYETCKFISGDIAEAMIEMRRVLKVPDPPDAICVSDDSMMSGLKAVLGEEGIVPGRDMGIIVLSNRGIPLPPGNEWSRLEFDPELFGASLVNDLVQALSMAGTEPATLAIYAKWIPGQTHFRQGG